MSYEYVKEWRKKAKERAIEAMGGECICCGYKAIQCQQAMEFHHLNDKEDKEFGISTSIASWSKIVEELRKCVLVCCRCHREIHYGVKVVPSNARRFNEEYVEYRGKKCKICKTVFSGPNATCSKECADRFRSLKMLSIRPVATKEELQDLC